MHSIRTAAILVALVTSACTGETVSPSAVASDPPVATASPSATPSASPPSLLEGTWTTAEITCDQQLATIQAAGFTDAQISKIGWACSGTAHWRLRFLADQLAQFGNGGDGPYELGSESSFELTDDHTLVLTDFQETLTFTLVGNVLTFVTFVSIFRGSTNNLDGQIHGAAIYLTAPFTREP
jgi:hypothetical protein